MKTNVPSEVLDLYKLAVELADRVSARRASANSFFLTVQTALAGALGGMSVLAANDRVGNPLLVVASIVGGLVAVAWWLVLHRYRALNTAKFEVIHEIEEEYFDIQLFRAEWEHIKEPRMRWMRWAGFTELGQVERLVPLVFAGLYVVVGALAVSDRI